jgi:hypothetical protein
MDALDQTVLVALHQPYHPAWRRGILNQFNEFEKCSISLMEILFKYVDFYDNPPSGK